MSDERELVDRLATIDATPRPDWVAELRANLDAAWETEDLSKLHSLHTTSVTLVDNEPAPSEQRRGRRWTMFIAAAATVLLVVVLASHDGDDGVPVDRPTVPPVAPHPSASAPRHARPTAGAGGVRDRARHVLRRRNRWNIDAADLPHRRRRVVDPWRRVEPVEGWARWLCSDDLIDVGTIAFGRPDQVYLDACHLSDGFHAGPVTTLDGLVTALSEQRGWANVTDPSDISVDGYPGKTFQRTAPTVISDCPNFARGHMRLPELDGNGLTSWLSGNDWSAAGLVRTNRASWRP